MKVNIKNRKWLLIMVIVFVTIIAGYFYTYEYLVKEVFINIDGDLESYKTTSNTVNEILEELNIKLSANDYISFDLKDKIDDDTVIVIKKSVPIVLYVDGQIIEVESSSETVSDVLEFIGVEVDNDDRIFPSLNDEIVSDMQINVVMVDKKINIENFGIQYTEVFRYNDNLEKGKTKKVQAGELGLLEITKEKIYERGKLVSEAIISKKVIKEPIPEVIEVGNKDVLLVSRGQISYSRALTMNATAYDLSFESIGKRPGDKGYGITATGTKARPGVVAVDPKIIPLGTKLYIESMDGTKDYGFAVAEDIGGAIKNNRIDLFFEDHTEALQFGRRNVKVYIIDK